MVRIEQLSVTLGEFRLKDISLDIRDREYFVVLGPTGAGKTVLLECIAGLTAPDRGRVWLGEREVTWLPPEQRRVGYLPQDYALFPHMTVRENLAFGLMVRGQADQAPAKISRYAQLLGIDHLLDRLPVRLSGGEKQRAALGRALAIDPEIMLLDEPLSALDVATRERIGDELRRIHEGTGITTLHICHNFDETLRLADRVALMHQGCIVQVGTPAEIMRRPNCLFAAEFVQAENIFEGTSEGVGPGRRIRIGSLLLDADTGPEGPVYVTIRPDDVDVQLSDASSSNTNNVLAATVDRIEPRGNGYALRTVGTMAVTAFVSRPHARRIRFEPGRPVSLHFPPGAVHAFAAGDSRGPIDGDAGPDDTPSGG